MDYSISVVIPSYNGERTVEEAVRSALRQSFPPKEVIVVDDCSSDRTGKIVRGIAEEDSRVRYFRNEENHGVSWNRNFGVREAEGEWIAFLDDDDLWMPDKLEKQCACLDEHPDIDMVYTGYGYMTADGIPYRYEFRVPAGTDVNGMLRRNVMSTSGLMIRRDRLTAHPFRSDVAHEDLFEWLTLLQSGARCAGVRECLHMVRLTGITSRSGNKTRAAGNRMRLYRQFGLGALQSGFCWCCYAVTAGIKYLSLRLGGTEKGGKTR